MQYKTNTGKTLNINDKNEINRGGEGRIVLIDNIKDKVAKIYHTPQSNLLEQKMLYLNKLDSSFFVTPDELLYKKNEFVGYTMQLVDSSYFPISTIFSKNFCKQNNINQDFKKVIIEKLIYVIENAHKNNIVIGDFNQYNILISKNADIKIIDTDSFETQNNKHSGILLEEIRDYYYNGIVNLNSDFFALSVIVFYLLTYTHPFKGVHKLFKSIRERMINKIPVFVKDSDLIIPNMYEAISDAFLSEQFTKIYIDGERFILSLQNVTYIQTTQTKQVTINKIEKNNIIITPIFNDTFIQKIYFNSEFGYIKTKNEIHIYSAQNKGFIQKKYTIKNINYDDIFIGHNNIILKQNEKLFHFIDYNKIVEIKNFLISHNSFFEQKDNILVNIDEDVMFYIYLDEVMNTSIKIQRQEIFGKSFLTTNGLMQNIGEIKRIFYNTEKVISSVKTDKNIKSIVQNKNIGIAQYIENKEVKQKYFTIKDNEIIFDINELEHIPNFGYMYNYNAESYIFETENKQITIKRLTDFKEISNFSCEYVNPDTKIYWTKAGLVCFDEENVFLLNNK